MENVKQILDELDDGYKYFAIKKDGCWYKIEFDSFMVKDIERAQNICSELNQMLKNACEGKKAGTGENNALLPDVSGSVLTKLDYWKIKCKLLEAIEKENPCDPDMTTGQINAYSDYHKFIERYGTDR